MAYSRDDAGVQTVEQVRYDKIKCESCDGTGYVPRSQGFYTINSDRRRRPRCHICMGFGYNVIGAKEEAKEQ